MGSPAQPLLNLRKRLGDAAQQFSDAHPIDSLETLFGVNQPKPAPAPDPNKDPYIIQQQKAALKSFQDAQDAAEKKDTPMGKMVRGALSKK